MGMNGICDVKHSGPMEQVIHTLSSKNPAVSTCCGFVEKKYIFFYDVNVSISERGV